MTIIAASASGILSTMFMVQLPWPTCSSQLDHALARKPPRRTTFMVTAMAFEIFSNQLNCHCNSFMIIVIDLLTFSCTSIFAMAFVLEISLFTGLPRRSNRQIRNILGVPRYITSAVDRDVMGPRRVAGW